MDWTKPFFIKNISGGRLVAGALSVPHLEGREINHLRFPEHVIEKLKLYHQLDKIEVTNDYTPNAKTIGNGGSVKEITTTKNEHGETRQHIVYDPNKASKAIETQEISTGKGIQVDSLLTESKSVEVEYSDIDKIEAKEFLDQHWKRVESEVGKITNKRKLNFYLAVAKEWAVADKKIEILENRIAVL